MSGIAPFKPGGAPDVDSNMAKELTGPGCIWRTGSFSPRATVHIRTIHQEKADAGLKGMDGVYASYETGLTDYFEPFDLDGYPAAISGQKKNIDAGDCSVNFGATDDLTIAVSYVDEENPPNACEAAKKIAAAALTTLKRGA